MSDNIFILLLALGAIVCSVIAGLMFRAARRERAMAAASLEWPAVPGRITTSQVKEGTRRHNNSSWTVYSPEVTFTYAVDDRSYTGGLIGVGYSGGLNSREKAEKVLAPYQVGSEVQVFYDPVRPDRAVLKPGSGGGNWLLFASAAMFGLLGIAGIAGIVGVLLTD